MDFSTLFTGKLAPVKLILGALAGLVVSLAPLAQSSGISGGTQAGIGVVVGIATWLIAHGFHTADTPHS